MDTEENIIRRFDWTDFWCREEDDGKWNGTLYSNWADKKLRFGNSPSQLYPMEVSGALFAGRIGRVGLVLLC